MNATLLVRWVASNAVGLGLACVAYLQTGFLMDFGFDFANHWQTEAKPKPDGSVVGVIVGLATVPLMLAVLGLIFGIAQASVLRNSQVRVSRWLLATIIGFGFMTALISPLEGLGIMGNIPGPVEPIIFINGGCILAGILQYYLLRQIGIHALNWLSLWTLGIVLSLIPTTLMFFVLQVPLDLSVSWPAEIFLHGMMCGGVAAWISGSALLTAVHSSNDTVPSRKQTDKREPG